MWKGITPKGTTIQFKGRDFVVFNLVIQKEREAVQFFQSVQALIPGELENIWTLMLCITLWCYQRRGSWIVQSKDLEMISFFFFLPRFD